MRLALRSWRDLTLTDALILGASASTAAAALYLLLKDDDQELRPEDVGGGKEGEGGKTVTSRQTVIEIKIPKDVTGTVIGRQGNVIKQV